MKGTENTIFPWGDERRFNSYAAYFRRLFGSRVQKLSVDAGFTCPNRDGTKGTGGCTYCNNDAFSPSYCTPSKSITTQIQEGITFHKKRYKEATSYLAYFQAYTNTYDKTEKLQALYEEALRHPGVIGLIVGTRPDCIDDEKLGLLRNIADKHYVAVEYGIESCSDITLKRINRGHTFGEAVRAVEKTAALGLNTGAHFIFGLPGESREYMLSQASVISSLPLTTVKFHQLQIIKGTIMEQQYLANPADFELFTLEDYLSFIISFLERLNPEIVVERITGEAPPRMLNKTLWGKKRTDQLVNLLENRLRENNTYQGRLYK